MPRQGCPVWHTGQQGLLVDHSNVLQPGTYFSPLDQGGFYQLVIESAALIFHLSYVPALLLAGYRGHGTSIQCRVLFSSLAHHDL